jgi:Sporulation and spore germination
MSDAGRRRVWALLAVAASVIVLPGCGVRPDSKPHDVPEDNHVDLSGPSVGTDASGAERIYLVEPGEDQLLRSVQRQASSASELMESLLGGPTPTELDEGYASAIPSTLGLLSAREQSPFLYVDVTDELTDLSGQGLLQALAQIVYTGSELAEVDRVQITVNGEVIAWPKANLESSTEPLSVYDYPSSVRTAQPAYPSLPGA